MKTETYVRCSDSCNQFYQYVLNDEKPVALTAQWRNEASKGGIWTGLLPNKPEIGKLYELSVWGALKINLREAFWASYLDPYSTHEGIESDEAIRNFRLCRCQAIEVLSITDKNLVVAVEVTDYKEISDFVFLPKTENSATGGNAENDVACIDDYVDSNRYWKENFENYSLLSINIESDLGWDFIVLKKDGKSTVVAENVWDFHRNTWQLTHVELTEEQEKRYGIQHLIP